MQFMHEIASQGVLSHDSQKRSAAERGKAAPDITESLDFENIADSLNFEDIKNSLNFEDIANSLDFEDISISLDFEHIEDSRPVESPYNRFNTGLRIRPSFSLYRQTP